VEAHQVQYSNGHENFVEQINKIYFLSILTPFFGNSLFHIPRFSVLIPYLCDPNPEPSGGTLPEEARKESTGGGTPQGFN